MRLSLYRLPPSQLRPGDLVARGGAPSSSGEHFELFAVATVEHGQSWPGEPTCLTSVVRGEDGWGWHIPESVPVLVVRRPTEGA